MSTAETILVIISIAMGCFIFALPLIIANYRKLSRNIIHMIGILSVFGIFFFGLGWLIALVMSICLKREEVKYCYVIRTNRRHVK
jgi:phage shock protein PspC (stress-responsive transcriptional regulator)